MSANINSKTKRRKVSIIKDGTRKISIKNSLLPTPSVLSNEMPSSPSLDDDISDKPPLESQLDIESIERKELQEPISNKELYPTFNDTSFNIQNLYPSLNDASFNILISNKPEFSDHSKGNIVPTCNSSTFDILPHQIFVRNFLSVHTPYNSLLLFHGLGSGKTCTAIGVAEEMRDYIINMNHAGKIFIIAAPNVAKNFELQLFNESKLTLKDGFWDIQSCTGPKFVREINPFMQKDMEKKTVVAMIKSLIRAHYEFIGYVQFSNAVNDCITDVGNSQNEERRQEKIIKRLSKKFSNSLLIIDEAHNIRDNVSDGKDEETNNGKLVYSSIIKLITAVDSIRLLLLSATPLFHSPTEIIGLLNLMNLNDRRKYINISDVFTGSGELKIDENGKEIGKEILTQKATGYISYVSGENLHTFPRRVWPSSFSPENAIPSINIDKGRIYPPLNHKGEETTPINHLSVYMNKPLRAYQCDAYEEVINIARTQNNGELSLLINRPIQCLNMIYPSDADVKYGQDGFDNSMMATKKDDVTGSIEYKPSAFGKFFNEGQIEKYSQKIDTICNIVGKASGMCLIYSQYIMGGIVPMALALEARGFVKSDNTTLFKHGINISVKNPKKYIMITGSFDSNKNDLKDKLNLLNSDENKDGNLIKVVLITKTGAEGLDLKFIRQVHIMEPWFNLSRIEQIIGRAVRQCSHQLLPIESRNVEIYLHVSERSEKFKQIEPVDLYLYQKSEINAIQIGKVTRILKTTAIDCIINKGDDMPDDTMNGNIITSSGVELNGADIKNDYSFSVMCDFMDSCKYECTPDVDESLKPSGMNTYHSDYLNVDVNKTISFIKSLFSNIIDGIFFFKRDDLYKKLPKVNKSTINAALELLLTEEYEYIIDKYGRKGKLINISDLYLFQPRGITDNKISIADRSFPVDIKNDGIRLIMPEDRKDANVESEYENIISEIIIKYNIATGVSPNSGGAKKKKQPEIKPEDIDGVHDTWVKECSESVNFIIKNYVVTQSTINETILDHIMEQLPLTYIITLLNKMHTDEMNEEDIRTRQMIVKYINGKKFSINEKKGTKGFLWWKYDTSSKKTVNIKIKTPSVSDRLCIIFSRDKGNTIWNEAEPVDIEATLGIVMKMRDKIQDLIPKALSGGKFGSFIGLMTEWANKRYIIFKIRNMNYNNKGTKCDNLSRVAAIANLLHGCSRLKMKPSEYELEEILKKGSNNICIIHELILRVLDKTYMDDKVPRRYLLSPVEVLLSGI